MARLIYGKRGVRQLNRWRSGPGGPQVWTVSGLLWPMANLIALAVGLFPHLITGRPPTVTAGLPALRALAAGQVAFALVVYPLILMHRPRRKVSHDAAELLVWVAMAVPFVIAAMHLADATVADAVRAALVSVAALVAGGCLGRLGRRGRATAGVVALIGLVAAAGGPLVVYIVWEFGPGASTAWPARVCPTTFAWQMAASMQGRWIPDPLWAWLLWPAVAAAATLGAMIGPRGKQEVAENE